MQVLVTGGAGYVGTGVVEALSLREEVQGITVYDNLSRGSYSFFLDGRGAAAKPMRFVRADLLDTFTLRREVERADVVVHLAAKVTTPFDHADALSMDQVNHWGTAELSYALERCKAKRVVYSSSIAVYGHADAVQSTTAATAPVTAYGRSKLAGEAMLARLGGHCSVAIARLANVYGYNRSMRFDAVINRMSFDAAMFGRVSIEGAGDQVRSFISIGRASAIVAELACRAESPSTINVSDHMLSITQIADGLSRLYPRLERLNIVASLPARNLCVSRDASLDRFAVDPPTEFEEDIEVLARHLAISPPLRHAP